MFCKNCGSKNSNNSKFCLNCGAELEDYTKPNKNFVMPADIKNQQSNKKTKKICRNLRYIAYACIFLGFASVLCSLFFLKITFIVISCIFLVATIGLGIAILVISSNQKKKNKLYKQAVEQQKVKQTRSSQTLPPQDDQINYKR